MTFKEATDVLFQRVDHSCLANAMSVSVASIRQARLNEKASAYRRPPAGWQAAVIVLAERRIKDYKALLALMAEE